MEKPVAAISVRNLVEFLLRSGDLKRGGMPDAEAMLKGSRLHRKLQKQMGSLYRAEVALKHTSEYEDLDIKVEGRADGIFPKDGLTVIDEIKGVYLDVSRLSRPIEVHRAQAMCYAYIYALDQGLDRIGVQMTYANLEDEEIHRFFEELTFDELASWYEDLLNEYHKWLSFRLRWKQKRNASVLTLKFPFEYRPGQRRMVSAIYHSIMQEKQIFVQAPTGIGKTMSSIFPALRAMGEGKADMVFYLTAKTITRQVAAEAFDILRDQGLCIKTILLTAREKLCRMPEADCDPRLCPYAKGHYDRINAAVYELMTRDILYDRESILDQADRHQVCPFELSLDLSEWADAVICDYNYAFDPNVHLKRFFGDSVRSDCIFLIDEAHNLVERGREMYSAELSSEQIIKARATAKNIDNKLYRSLGRASRQLLKFSEECSAYIEIRSLDTFPLTLLNLAGEMDRVRSELDEKDRELPEELLDMYFSLRDFMNVLELMDENYVIYGRWLAEKNFQLRLFCVSPAHNLQTYLDKGKAAVFFSATLLPMPYYGRLLSDREDDFGICLPSPFPKENMCLLIGRDVSSRYNRRGYDQYQKIARYIAELVWAKRGNYMAFFPSYAFMEEVLAIYRQEFASDWVREIIQETSMTEAAREEFLEEFRKNASRPEKERESLLGFCVMGGMFSEGIDLKGDQLIGAAVVGTGIPQIGPEREILKNYYDAEKQMGFDYAYRFPGMNKVQQSAGRVIRTGGDRGVILLLDERFAHRENRDLFPDHWQNADMVTLADVRKKVTDFWLCSHARTPQTQT